MIEKREENLSIRSAQSGINGERRFDEYFSFSKLNFPHIILHDVSLKSVPSFQMDSLLIVPWNLYVFEIKNMSGRLHFKPSPPQLAIFSHQLPLFPAANKGNAEF